MLRQNSCRLALSPISVSTFDREALLSAAFNLVPRARHPENPVIVLTRLALYPMGDLALKNGAQAFVVKSQSSGDALSMAIHAAIDKVPQREGSFGAT